MNERKKKNRNTKRDLFFFFFNIHTDCHCFRDPVLQLLLHHNYTKRQQCTPPSIKERERYSNRWYTELTTHMLLEEQHRADQPFRVDFMQKQCLFKHCIWVTRSGTHTDNTEKQSCFRNTESHNGVCPHTHTQKKTQGEKPVHMCMFNLHWRPDVQLNGSGSLTRVKPVPTTPSSR